MTRRRRRAVLALGALAAAAAHCAALEPSGRRLITFDEAHNALADTATEVANEAVNTASNIVSSLLGTDSSEETTPSLSVTIGTTMEDPVAEKTTSEDDDTPTTVTEAPTTIARTPTPTTETPTTIAEKTPTTEETTAPTATRQSGISHAVSMTKSPTATLTRTPTVMLTRAPRTPRHTDYSSSDTTGNESADKSETDATPTAAPAPTQPPTKAPVAVTEAPITVTEAPVTIVISTPAPGAAPVTDIPVTVVTTAPVVQTETPVPTDTPLPTTQSSAIGTTPESGVDDATDAPANTGSTTDDAAVIIPDESTVVPITEIPAEETGSADAGTPAAGVPTSPDSPATWIAASGSNSINETVKVDSASGSEENSEGISPGQVHASSSADVSVNGSDMSEVESSNSYHGGKQKKDKNNRKSHSGSGDCSAGGSTTSSKGGSKSSTSNSGSSDDGSSGLGHLVNPGGVSDVNTSSATYYSLGTGSIVAIVGVIAGIVGVLVMFVAIGRKKYSDDDGESPLPYGYNMDIRSVARLSPTFMQDDSFMESGYNGTALMVAVPPNHFDGASSTSGESADEVPSLRGNMMAANHCDPLGDISMRSRVPSMQSFSGDLETGNVRMSALYSAGSSMTSSSAISGTWSSVLASDTDRQTTRNTRDTSLSAWSAANLSSFGSTASGASGMYRNTRSSSALSGLSGDLRQTGGSDRSRSSSRLTNQSDVSRVAAGPVESNRSDKSTEI